jgi:hypothetical protein
LFRIEENEPEVYDFEQKSWRTQDWVENKKYSKMYESESEEEPGEFLYQENSDYRPFRYAMVGNFASKKQILYNRINP